MKNRQRQEIKAGNQSTSNAAGIRVVRAFSSVIDYVVMIILLLLLVYSCYSMWDSSQVYVAASAGQFEQYKPTPRDTKSFEELKKENPEVFAWLKVYGTEIDYPVVQSPESNQKYIYTDVYGNYSASGSIFLDKRNNKKFTDFNSIIYGHHMQNSGMFGDLDKFEDKEYFDTRQYANLYYGGKDHGVEFFAYIMGEAYDWTLYNPAIQGDNNKKEDYLSYIIGKAKYTRDIEVSATDNIVILSTCASEPTNGRHILVGKITDEKYSDTFEDTEEGSRFSVDSQGFKSFIEKIPHWGWIVILFVIILILLLLITLESTHQKKRLYKKDSISRDEENRET